MDNKMKMILGLFVLGIGMNTVLPIGDETNDKNSDNQIIKLVSENMAPFQTPIEPLFDRHNSNPYYNLCNLKELELYKSPKVTKGKTPQLKIKT